MSVVIRGLPELKAEFTRIDRDVGKRVLRKGGSAGARVVKTAVAQKVPVKSGVLKRSLLVKYVREKSSDTQALYLVTFRQGKKFQTGAVTKRKGKFFKRVLSQDAFYARWVEAGHHLRRKGESVGYVQGRFFMRDGARSSAGPAAQKMVDVMTEETKLVIKA